MAGNDAFLQPFKRDVCEKARGGLLGALFRLGLSITQRSLAFSSVVYAMHEEVFRIQQHANVFLGC
jgi:hypothetical protein